MSSWYIKTCWPKHIWQLSRTIHTGLLVAFDYLPDMAAWRGTQKANARYVAMVSFDNEIARSA